MRIAFGAIALATCLLAACSGPQGPRVKQERRAKKETQDRLGRWDQKAIRVHPAQWDRPVPQASQVFGS